MNSLSAFLPAILFSILTRDFKLYDTTQRGTSSTRAYREIDPAKSGPFGFYRV
jgi:hypothetical protein